MRAAAARAGSACSARSSKCAADGRRVAMGRAVRRGAGREGRAGLGTLRTMVHEAPHQGGGGWSCVCVEVAAGGQRRGRCQGPPPMRATGDR